MGFLEEVVATRAPDEEIHVILDNLSTHTTKLVEASLAEHLNVTPHFTPPYSSPGRTSRPTACPPCPEKARHYLTDEATGWVPRSAS